MVSATYLITLVQGSGKKITILGNILHLIFCLIEDLFVNAFFWDLTMHMASYFLLFNEWGKKHRIS